jgi:UDP-MurNAc hydroxylase
MAVPYAGSTALSLVPPTVRRPRRKTAAAGGGALSSGADKPSTVCHLEKRPRKGIVQVTSLGHAGFLVQTHAGNILCDPWVNPAYFASWFPFPDNSALDWGELGDCDYLYLSHLHRDHFDAKNLREHVN